MWNSTREKGNILAIGVNCLSPKVREKGGQKKEFPNYTSSTLQNVTPLLSSVGNAHREDPIPLIAYPNSGEEYDEREG